MRLAVDRQSKRHTWREEEGEGVWGCSQSSARLLVCVGSGGRGLGDPAHSRARALVCAPAGARACWCRRDTGPEIAGQKAPWAGET